ncbi:hypothetical protein [Aeromonas jandaei]|uniref:hypothetical protein n=1 Tax=Aeromonas jandaei TaxID=650 RepID=UPI003BA063EB
MLLCYVMVASLVDAFYLQLEQQAYRQSLDTRIQREADNLLQMTLSSKGMGAVQLVGRLNREIQQSSLLEKGNVNSSQALQVLAQGSVVTARFNMKLLDTFLAGWGDTIGLLVAPDGVVMATNKEEW